MRFEPRYVLPAIAVALATSLGSAAPGLAADASFNGADADGTVAAFSTPDKLVPGDTDSRRDVYQRSFDAGVGAYVTREASTGPAGGNDAYDATFQAISANGAEIFFSTDEPLVAADTDRAADVYAHDTETGATVLISRAAASCSGGPCGSGAGAATYRGASSDGEKIFFETGESLSVEDGDESADVYLRDLAAEPPTTTLVSQAGPSCSGSCGDGATSESFAGAAADGSVAFFESSESLVAADTDSTSDVYARELTAEPPRTELVSPAGTCPAGVDAAECRPRFRGVSADGSRVFFTTSERLAGDADNASDVFAWDGTTAALVSTGPAASGEDRPATYKGSTPDGGTVFLQTGEKLTAADEDGTASDVYARDLDAGTTSLASAADPTCVDSLACGKASLNASFSGASEDGSIVFFQTDERLAPDDPDGVNDVYARDLGAGTTALVSSPSPACEGGACGAAAPATFAAASADGTAAAFSTEEVLVEADEDEAKDVYMRDLAGESTTLESRSGICPLPGEAGCDASFAGASADLGHVFFRSVERLTAEDVDSDLDVYERAEGQTRLVSAGNSVNLGPSTPVLTGTTPSGTGETTTPGVLGHADPESSIKIYTTADCSGEVFTGTVAALEGGGIAVSVEPETTTSFRATATDSNGDTSGCSNAISYTQQPPAIEEEGGGGGGGEEEGGGGPDGEGGGDSGGGGGSGGGTTPAPSPPRAPIPAPIRLTPGGVPYVTPVTRITFGPAFKTRARRPVFRFADATGQPGTRFICRLDRRKWRGCSSPVRLKHVRRGRHVFRVKAVNAVGTWEARPTRRAFKLVGRGGVHRKHARHDRRRPS